MRNKFIIFNVICPEYQGFIQLKAPVLSKYSLQTYFFKALTVVFALKFFLVEPALAEKPKFTLDSLKTKHVWYAAQLIPGSGQVINKQYWKVPIVWGGIGSMMYLGYQANSDYKAMQKGFDPIYFSPEEILLHHEKWEITRRKRNAYYTGAALFYFASVSDALLVHSKGKHSPVVATVFSTFLPGLGQIYNQKYWKVPVIYGGLASFYYVIDFNNRGFERFRTAHLYLTDKNPDTVDEFNGTRSAEELIYYREAYRRNRDLSVITGILFYVMNIIDANVDANLYDWDISDNLALRIEPIVSGDVMARTRGDNSAFGFSCKLNF